MIPQRGTQTKHNNRPFKHNTTKIQTPKPQTNCRSTYQKKPKTKSKANHPEAKTNQYKNPKLNIQQTQQSAISRITNNQNPRKTHKQTKIEQATACPYKQSNVGEHSLMKISPPVI